MSVDPSANQEPKRPYSIDLSLELEHQLETDSLPPTPAAKGRPASYDQNVVASVIQQLQTDVERLTRERDDLREELVRVDADKSGVQETLLQFSAKCERMEEELEAAKAKMQDDEHAINMLRTKVEESRRGLMRLQTENRRMSQANMTIDTTRTSLTSFGKRQSFTPLTGTGATRPNAHKRISSISDSGFLLSGSVDIPCSPSPNAQTITMPDLSSSTPTGNNTRGSSVFSTRSSPPQSLDLAPRDPVLEELEALRREMKSLKVELEDTRNELSEAIEAREASETCAKALREFIGEMKPSATESEAVKLPPMPTDTTSAEEDIKQASTGWGFRMWKMEPTVKPENTSVPPVDNRRMWKLDATAKAAPANTTTSSPSIHQPTVSTSSTPFVSKVGVFFSSRGSVTSTTSSTPPPRQSILQEPSVNHSSSDTSSIGESVAEPMSPADGAPAAIVKIRGGSVSSSADFIPPEHFKALNDRATTVVQGIPTPAS